MAESAAATQWPADWDFVALLGGEPISTHRGVVTPSRAHSFAVVSDARSDGSRAAPVGAGVEFSGCVMSYAYWNPALAAWDRLLDPATGRLMSVAFASLPVVTINVRDPPTSVRGMRITGLAHPIDVWYADDRWVELDTTVDGRRRPSHRLR